MTAERRHRLGRDSHGFTAGSCVSNPLKFSPQCLSNSFTRTVNGSKQLGVDLVHHDLPLGWKLRSYLAALIHSAPHAINIGDSHHHSTYAGRDSPQGKSDAASSVPSDRLRQVHALYSNFDFHGSLASLSSSRYRIGLSAPDLLFSPKPVFQFMTFFFAAGFEWPVGT